MHCCRLTGVVSLGSSYSFHSEGPGGSAAEGNPRETQGEGQGIDVRMAEVQGDRQSQSERVARQVALQVGLATYPNMQDMPEGAETGQPMQIGMATPRAGQAESQGNAEAPDPSAVSTWTEERMLEPATSLPAMRTIRHQPRNLRQRTCTKLKKLLQHHTNCRHQWVERRDYESLQAELAAARWAWLGPTLLVRAYGGEHAVNDGLTPRQRRKLSIELAGKRAAVAETGVWTELLRLYVRDMLTREVDARGDGTHTMQQSTTLKADTMRASDKMDSCDIRAALQILQTNTRAPPNIQTAAEVHSLFAVDTDEQQIVRIKMQCAAIKQAAANFSPPTSEAGEAYDQRCCASGRAGPQRPAKR